MICCYCCKSDLCIFFFIFFFRLLFGIWIIIFTSADLLLFFAFWMLKRFDSFSSARQLKMSFFYFFYCLVDTACVCILWRETLILFTAIVSARFGVSVYKRWAICFCRNEWNETENIQRHIKWFTSSKNGCVLCRIDSVYLCMQMFCKFTVWLSVKNLYWKSFD